MTLDAVLVPTWRQILPAVRGLLDTAERHSTDRGIAPETLIGARLHDDMLPFAYQVKSCWTHSVAAVDGVRAGRFEPDRSPSPDTFDGLREQIDSALAMLDRLAPDALEALADRPMVFAIGDRLRLDFTVRNFLLSFSQPNFLFHATTAYAILRANGVPLGKRDFLGALRTEPS